MAETLRSNKEAYVKELRLTFHFAKSTVLFIALWDRSWTGTGLIRGTLVCS